MLQLDSVEEDDDSVDSDYDYEDSISIKSSLSMSVESHGSLQNPLSSSLSAQIDEEMDKIHIRQRKLSVSMLYEEGCGETRAIHMNENNPLSYDDNEEDDTDFQKLSFTKQRKMSDATGW